MTPAESRAVSEFLATMAKAKAHEAESKALEATAISHLAKAILALASNVPDVDERPKGMTPVEFAEAHGMSKSLVYQMMKVGRLPYEQVSERKRVIDERQAWAAFQASRARLDSESEGAAGETCRVDERAVKRAALHVVGGSRGKR